MLLQPKITFDVFYAGTMVDLHIILDFDILLSIPLCGVSQNVCMRRQIKSLMISDLRELMNGDLEKIARISRGGVNLRGT